MKVRDKKNRHVVDVLDADCLERPCYWFGFDKGSFTPGRGYTSYNEKERPCCLERHIHGCPSNSICPKCRLSTVLGVGTKCKHPGCDGITIEREGE